MSFNYFLRRASSSMTLQSIRSIRSVSPYLEPLYALHLQNCSFQFPTLVRFFTAPVDQSCNKLTPLEKAAPDAGKTLMESTPRDGFCFDHKSGPEIGSLTLTRKYQNEIIEIQATAYQNVMDYFKDRYFEQSEVDVLDVNSPCLHLMVDIRHGYMYRMNIIFNVLAFADSPDKIFIRNMFSRVLPCEGENSGRLYLEDYKDFLKNKGIDPTSLKYFLSVLSLEDSFNNDENED